MDGFHHDKSNDLVFVSAQAGDKEPFNLVIEYGRGEFGPENTSLRSQVINLDPLRIVALLPMRPIQSRSIGCILIFHEVQTTINIQTQR
jgi:hypothetical protein